MPGHWVQLASFTRQGPFLTHLEPVVTLQPLVPVEARFGPVLRLAGFWLSPDRSQPGSTLPVVLQWVADAPPPADYTVFIHLVAPDGSLVAQSDAVPHHALHVNGTLVNERNGNLGRARGCQAAISEFVHIGARNDPAPIGNPHLVGPRNVDDELVSLHDQAIGIVPRSS